MVEDVIDPADLVALERRCDEIIANKETMAFDWAWEDGTRPQPSASSGSSRAARAGAPREFDDRAVPHVGRRVRLGAARHAGRVLVRPVPRQAAARSAATRWHQDEGYWGRALDDRGITCWMPFHDVDERNGCMHFIDGGHRDGVLAHERPPDMQSDLLVLPPRRVPRRRLPDPARQRHVPPRQDAAHDDRQHDAARGAGS